jgi:hypothetical protein
VRVSIGAHRGGSERQHSSPLVQPALFSHKFQWNTGLSSDVSFAWIKRDQIDQIEEERLCWRRSRAACERFICSFKRIIQRMPNGFFVARKSTRKLSRPSRGQRHIAMPQNPNCPKCGRAMTLRRTTRAPHPADDRYVFECPHCKVTYATKDHIPSARPRDD